MIHTSSVHPPASIIVANIKRPLPTIRRNHRPSGILKLYVFKFTMSTESS